MTDAIEIDWTHTYTNINRYKHNLGSMRLFALMMMIVVLFDVHLCWFLLTFSFLRSMLKRIIKKEEVVDIIFQYILMDKKIKTNTTTKTASTRAPLKCCLFPNFFSLKTFLESFLFRWFNQKMYFYICCCFVVVVVLGRKQPKSSKSIYGWYLFLFYDTVLLLLIMTVIFFVRRLWL